jgi:photosystem II protein
MASKKIQHKEPLGPFGDVKWWKGVDVLGRTIKGKGVYQFVKKYGANVDNYSPIYAPDEW